MIKNVGLHPNLRVESHHISQPSKNSYSGLQYAVLSDTLLMAQNQLQNVKKSHQIPVYQAENTSSMRDSHQSPMEFKSSTDQAQQVGYQENNRFRRSQLLEAEQFHVANRSASYEDHRAPSTSNSIHPRDVDGSTSNSAVGLRYCAVTTTQAQARSQSQNETERMGFEPSSAKLRQEDKDYAQELSTRRQASSPGYIYRQKYEPQIRQFEHCKARSTIKTENRELVNYGRKVELKNQKSLIEQGRLSHTACPSSANLVLKSNYAHDNVDKYFSSSKSSPLRPTTMPNASDLGHQHHLKPVVEASQVSSSMQSHPPPVTAQHVQMSEQNMNMFSLDQVQAQPLPHHQQQQVQYQQMISNGWVTPQSPNFPVLQSPGILDILSLRNEQQKQSHLPVMSEQESSLKNGFLNSFSQLRQMPDCNFQPANTTGSTELTTTLSLDMSSSKLNKLLNVFEAASIDLKTYSVTQIESESMVVELQQSLGIIANYLDLAKTELLQQLQILRHEQVQTLKELKKARDRKIRYKNKLRHNLLTQRSNHVSDSVSQRSKSRQVRSTARIYQPSRQTKASQSRSRSNSIPNEVLTYDVEDEEAEMVTTNQTMESDRRRELVNEVKDLTAKNAQMLLKFKEFQQKKPRSKPGERKKENDSNRNNIVAPLPLNDYVVNHTVNQSKKDSIHQMTESDRPNKKKHRLRRQSHKSSKNNLEHHKQAYAIKQVMNHAGKGHRLSSTMMNIHKGAKGYQDVDGSSQQIIMFQTAKITSPDHVNSFNVEQPEIPMGESMLPRTGEQSHYTEELQYLMNPNGEVESGEYFLQDGQESHQRLIRTRKYEQDDFQSEQSYGEGSKNKTMDFSIKDSSMSIDLRASLRQHRAEQQFEDGVVAHLQRPPQEQNDYDYFTQFDQSYQFLSNARQDKKTNQQGKSLQSRPKTQTGLTTTSSKKDSTDQKLNSSSTQLTRKQRNQILTMGQGDLKNSTGLQKSSTVMMKKLAKNVFPAENEYIAVHKYQDEQSNSSTGQIGARLGISSIKKQNGAKQQRKPFSNLMKVRN